MKVEILKHKYNTVVFNNHQIKNENIGMLNNPLENIIRINHLNCEEKEKLLRVLKNYEFLFFKEGQNSTFTNKIKHNINTKNDIPIFSRSYRYPYIHKEEVKRQIDKMLEQKIIRPSFSASGSHRRN